MIELEDRVDFAERMLAKGREPDRLPSGADDLWAPEAIAFVGLCVLLAKVFTDPVAKAPGTGFAAGTARRRIPRWLAEMDQLRERLAEVEERLDFAERLLARGAKPTSSRGSATMITAKTSSPGSTGSRAAASRSRRSSRTSGSRAPPEGAEVVVHYAPPVVILRVRVMELPAQRATPQRAFRQLLEFNARELVHGSYGLEGDHMVLTDTLELENLDFSEFEASFDSITLALASHLGALAPYRER